ncbi:MAG TPA: glycosyltransferase family 39 protein [archaeon]|nr:glycosyltransferase family 39 protein [archaeon]
MGVGKRFFGRNYGLILLAIILVTAFFLRFNDLSWETYGYGEVEIKQAADEYVKGNFVNNFYIFDTPPLSKYMFALSIAIFGASESALRIVPLIFGMLTIVAIFLATRKMYNEKTALLASAITAFSILQIEFSRYAQLETMLSFFYVLTVYFLWGAVNNRKYAYVFFGLSLGLSIAIKFTSVIILVGALVYILYTKQVKFSIKPSFSISIKNWILKSLVIALAVFIVSWPFGFSQLYMSADISVNYGGQIREQHIEADAPIMLLSFARRIFSSVESDVVYPLAMKIPILNYFLLYAVRESLLFLALLVAGIYFAARKPLQQDRLIIIFIVTFLVLLSFQRTLISYRHIVPMVPLLAIISSRWLTKLSNSKQFVSISVIGLILLLYAALSGTSYSLSYNPLKNVLGVPDSEFRFSEGMRETIDYAKENCESVFTSDYYKFIMEPYYDKFSPSAECAVKGISGTAMVDEYVVSHSCVISKTITKNSISLIEIYSC